MLAAGEIDAYAANRQRLTEMAERFPGLRVLPDNFYAVDYKHNGTRRRPPKSPKLPIQWG
jgi:hypothetical protein